MGIFTGADPGADRLAYSLKLDRFRLFASLAPPSRKSMRTVYEAR